ncbi:MAG: BamA/OMP85 family outer membrane protein, partial [Chitinophagales bacterium]
MKKLIVLLSLFMLVQASSIAQSTGATSINVDYTAPQDYEIGGIQIEGTEHLDKKVLISISGLRVGDIISLPGDDIAKAIKNLWNQKLFTDVSVEVENTIGSVVFLVIKLEELPRLSRYSIDGVKNGDVDDLRKKLNLRSGSIFTESDRLRVINTIKGYYIDKGFYYADVDVVQSIDEVLENSIKVDIFIEKGDKVKINQITFDGNEEMSERKLEKQMKDTREKVKFELAELIKFKKNRKDSLSFFQQLGEFSATRTMSYGDDFVNLNIFKSSKFNEENYENDKEKLLYFYRDKGYRDVQIVYDSVWFDDDGEANINILIDEGDLYHFRDVTWAGNTMYSDSILSKILNVTPGDVYSQSVLDQKLYMNPQGGDVSSLYMDDGYLFFNITPIEKRIDNDSVDIELRIYEGPQATINEIRIMGNTKTNEKVIRRELTIVPGNKFSRSDLIRSQRQIANLGYFDPEQMEVIPYPNPENGTVDIEFRVVEKPSDQLELSAGWGGKGNGIVGTLGVQFTNFSLKNMFDKKAWAPLPSGDGQNLTVRIQANGKQFQSYNFSFTEPWLGGKKANSFSVSFFRQRWNDLSDGLRGDVEGKLITTGGSIGIGTRLKWPDDYFVLQSSLNVQRYNLEDFFVRDFIFTSGKATNINFSTTLSRNSIDNPLFPTRGSNISLTVDFTLPYSRMFKGRRDIDYTNPELSDETRYQWIEYHKWRFNAEWYTPIAGKLTLRTAAKLGFLGTYNKDIGTTPFERYELGGEGFNQATFLGRDVLGLRGYDVITPSAGAPI